MSNISLSRRQALLGAAAAAGAGTLSGLQLPSTHAKAPMSTTQAPYFYRFNHGKM